MYIFEKDARLNSLNSRKKEGKSRNIDRRNANKFVIKTKAKKKNKFENCIIL